MLGYRYRIDFASLVLEIVIGEGVFLEYCGQFVQVNNVEIEAALIALFLRKTGQEEDESCE